MRVGLVCTLVAFLTGTSLGLAQTSGVRDHSAVPEAPAPEIVKKLAPTDLPPLERPVTPYWPNPVALEQCQPPGLLPGMISTTGPGDCTESCWTSIEYLLLWIKKGPLAAPLVTTGSTATLGALGNSDTTVLFGGSGMDYDALSGARLTSGFWFGRGSTWGMEGSFFFTDRQPFHFTAISSDTGTPLLARPVVNAMTGQETVLLISDPGSIAGNLTVNSSSKLYGWEVNAVDRIYKTSCAHLELIGGIRYIHLDEDLAIIQNSADLPGGISGFAPSAINPPGAISLTDRFDTRNDFYGAQFGVRGEYSDRGFFVNSFVKVAVGDNHEVNNVTGLTQRTPLAGSPSTVSGGLLALTSNSGRIRHDMFAVVPELGVNLGYQVNPLLRVFIGYSFLYWSDVVRPGDQVSRIINPNLVPTSQFYGTPGGPALPMPSSQRTDFWAQGMNVGIELRY